MARLSDIHAETKFATPVGAVEACASGVVPSGWLECDGAILDASTNTQYQRLFDTIGIVYGGTNNTDFVLPDLRGEFIRGLDNGRGVDAGRSNGTAQTNQLGQHTHPSGSLSANPDNAPHPHPGGAPNGGVNAPHYHGIPSGNSGFNGGPVTGYFANQYGSSPTNSSPANAPHGHPTGAVPAANAPHGHATLAGSAGATGGTANSNEIRPRNVAMCYIIKY